MDTLDKSKSGKQQPPAPTKILLSFLLFGVITASLVWLFLVPRRGEITDKQAQRLHFPNARLYKRSQAILESARVKKMLNEQEYQEAAELIRLPYVTVQVTIMIAMSDVARTPGQEDKALDNHWC